ncbi:MAG: ATP-dependent helicase [Pseudobdellovibrionaceae bacterium]
MVGQILKDLNEPQRSAVETVEGPLLILAGAGSGKTRVLTQRVAYIIAKGLAAPDEILCVTFTNKAAREMEHRIYKTLSELGHIAQNQLWVSTFHSFCVRLLRQHLQLLDYKPYFGIYDSSDQISQIKKVMSQLNINDKMHPPKNFQSRISSAKMLGLSPDDLKKQKQFTADQKTIQVYEQYEFEMKKSNSLDFDDLLLKTYEIFRMYPEILSMYQNKFRYIMVDEYQDTNHIQYLLVQMLSKSHRNLCVVGDEDQSIYSWRGADISNILDFEKDFPEAKIVKLEENYRSTQTIVTAATTLIKNNTQRKDKTLFTSNPQGAFITVREERNEYDEARFVAKNISQVLAQGRATLEDFAIFYRTNAQSRVLEEQLRLNAIPYRLVGGVRFYDRMEIKDVVSYMKLTLNLDDDIAFKRVINTPARGIGKTTVDKLEEIAFKNKISIFKAAQIAIETKVLNAGTTSKIRRFLDLVENLFSQHRMCSLPEFYHFVLDQTQYLQQLKKEDTPESQARIENLEELDNAIAQFVKERGNEATLQSYLEEMALVSDLDSMKENQNAVTMMTLHISKGLEFPFVFIVGLEENLFPSGRSTDESGNEDVEEERRLAYVGMTRAREKLFLTYCRTRKVWGQDQMNAPSRFLQEIDKNLVQFETTVDAPKFFSKYGNMGSAGGTSSWNQPSSRGFESQSFANDDEDSSGWGDLAGPKKSSEYTPGMKVKHPTFGLGSIYATEGSGEDLKVSVMVRDQTIKKFVVKYARLEKMS